MLPTVLHLHSKRTAQILIRCQACLRNEGNNYDHLLEFSVSYTILHAVILPSVSGFLFNKDILCNIRILGLQ